MVTRTCWPGANGLTITRTRKRVPERMVARLPPTFSVTMCRLGAAGAGSCACAAAGAPTRAARATRAGRRTRRRGMEAAHRMTRRARARRWASSCEDAPRAAVPQRLADAADDEQRHARPADGEERDLPGPVLRHAERDRVVHGMQRDAWIQRSRPGVDEAQAEAEHRERHEQPD